MIFNQFVIGLQALLISLEAERSEKKKKEQTPRSENDSSKNTNWVLF